jgi:hypothetical protein
VISLDVSGEGCDAKKESGVCHHRKEGVDPTSSSNNNIIPKF